MQLTFSILPKKYQILKYDPNHPIPNWVYQSGFYSITKTDEELSIVCETDVIKERKEEHVWKALKIEGQLDFSLIGIMKEVSTILANGGVSIFTISTYDTDYILVKENLLEKSIKLLKEADHKIN